MLWLKDFNTDRMTLLTRARVFFTALSSFLSSKEFMHLSSKEFMQGVFGWGRFVIDRHSTTIMYAALISMFSVCILDVIHT